MEYWKLLLIKHRERGGKGFTLPFLIGSQAYLSTSHSWQGINDIITDMVENNSFETCIRFCLDTNALIFEVRNPNNQVAYPYLENAHQNNLSIAIGNNNLGSTVAEITESLKDKFQDKIEKSLFSATRELESRETNWGNFTESDISFIKKCFEVNCV